jgi:hypothetical protein
MKECLTSEGNCKRYSTALRIITSMVLLKCEENYEIAAYIPREIVL